MLLELRRWEKETGEKVYLYDTTMQFEGYTGEICQNDYTRVVDTTFPDVDNSFWSVCVVICAESQRRPIHCHLHVNVVPISDSLSDDATDMESAGKEVEKWLDQSWMEKEKQLTYFTKHQTYDDDWNVNRVWIGDGDECVESGELRFCSPFEGLLPLGDFGFRRSVHGLRVLQGSELGGPLDCEPVLMRSCWFQNTRGVRNCKTGEGKQKDAERMPKGTFTSSEDSGESSSDELVDSSFQQLMYQVIVFHFLSVTELRRLD